MKQIALLLLAVTLISCSKDEAKEELPPVNYQSQGGQVENTVQMGDQQSSMSVTKEAIALTASTMQDTSIVKLSCGCDFKIVAESFTGDTNVIKFAQYNTPVPEAHRVGLAFSANKSAAKGNYTARLAFLNTGNKGNYRDTITVNYTL